MKNDSQLQRSIALKKQQIRFLLFEHGMRINEINLYMKMEKNQLRKYVKELRTEAKKKPKRPSNWKEEYNSHLKSILSEEDSSKWTVAKMASELKQKFGLEKAPKPDKVRKHLKDMGFSYKKAGVMDLSINSLANREKFERCYHVLVHLLSTHSIPIYIDEFNVNLRQFAAYHWTMKGTNKSILADTKSPTWSYIVAVSRKGIYGFKGKTGTIT